MTDLETTLRNGFRAIDVETAGAARPDLGSVILRARAPIRSRRRWPKFALAVAAGAAVTSGVAAAVGVLPAPVEHTLSEFRSWGFSADQGAQMMASTTDDGFTYELWRAPLASGGQCTYVRVSGPAGEVENGGGSSCYPGVSESNAADDFLDLIWPGRVWDNSAGRHPGAREHATASGRLPADATEIVFDFEDSPSLSVQPQRGGYFVTTFPGVADGTRVTAVRAVDATGRTLSVRRP